MFNNKIVNIIFSILVAIGLWIYVVGEINPNTTGKFQDLPIRFVNATVLAEDHLALVDPGNPLVTVTVSGTRADMKNLDPSEIDITADLSGLQKGENQIKLTVSLPNDMKLQSISSNKVQVTVETMETAEVPIQIQYEGTIADGKEPGEITISPATVLVRGAASSIKKVQYVAAVISAAQINATPKELEAGLSPVDKNGKPVSFLFLSQEQAKVTVTLLELKTVPLSLTVNGNVPNGYILESKNQPDSITVKGTAEALSQVESISAEPMDISGETASVNLPIILTLPAGIEVSTVSVDLTLQLTITPVTVKTFKYNGGDLTLKGLAAGLAVDLPTQTIQIAVQSSAEISSGLVAKDFSLSLNLESLKAGTYRVPILVETSKTGFTYLTTPTDIQITIREE